MTTQTTSEPPECGYEYNFFRCVEVGDHYCELRADRVVNFFAKRCVHTDGRYRGKAFILTEWQDADIIRPIFGTVRWSEEYGEYVRRYRTAWIEIGRKNGKSELLAGIMLYLLGFDGEGSAQLYGCARDKKQAALVFNVAAKMVRLSPHLSKVFKVVAHSKRIVHEDSDSYYEVIAADGESALGSNPSGVAADEILAWRNRDMWDALETGMGSGARRHPLLVAATTAGKEGENFGKHMHDHMCEVAADPAMEPDTFTYIRNTPRDADPFDEQWWYFANPALGDFLSIEAFRAAARKALNDPKAENAFRQFRINQWVAQSFRWANMQLYDEQQVTEWESPHQPREVLAGRTCYAGMDLSGRFDLTSWCLVFPPEEEGEPVRLVWRFWATEAATRELDKVTDGKFSEWCAAGWVHMHEGSVLDYRRIYEDIAEDGEAFAVAALDADEFSMIPVINQVALATGLDPEFDVSIYGNTYKRMSPAMGHVEAALKDGVFDHGGNPVAKWCFSSVEVKTAPGDENLITPVKPRRSPGNHRIDGVVTAALALACWKIHEDDDDPGVYASGGSLMVI